MVLILILFLFQHLYAEEGEVNLLPNQAYYAQISGTCYAHAGNSVLVALNLQKNKKTGSVVEPHPLLVTALGKTHQEMGYISGGHSCDILNDAKDLNDEICSVDALSLFLESKALDNKKIKLHFNDLIIKFDDLLSNYAFLLNEIEEFSKKDIILLSSSEHEIEDSVCELSELGLGGSDLQSLSDFNQSVIKQIKEDMARSVFDEVANLGIRVVAGQSILEARDGQIVEEMARKKMRTQAASSFLKKFYTKLNTSCLAYQKELMLGPVSKDFFEASKTVSCSKVDTSKSVSDSDLKSIVEQISRGLPVPIGLCAMPFEGEKRAFSREENPNCEKSKDLHAVTIIGHKTNSAGKKIFLIKNSWGENQCDDFNKEVRKCVRGSRNNCVDISEIACRGDNYELSEDYLKTIMLDYAHVQ